MLVASTGGICERYRIYGRYFASHWGEGSIKLSKQGRKNPKSRWGQIVVTRDRTKRNIARKGRTYDSNRLSNHGPKRNRKFKVSGKRRGSFSLEFPKSLSLNSENDTLELFRLIHDMRSRILEGKHKRIVLDHKNVEYMTPEAALLILSEIQRCEEYCKGKTEITGTHPRVHAVTELLDEIGFYEALSIKAPALPASYKKRTYVRIERRDMVDPEIADSLIDCFSSEHAFPEEDRKRLHVALVECMDNVFEHAYDLKSPDPYLYKEWWLAGYADHSDSSIGFIFYDQGKGIASAIKRKKRKIIERSKALLTWTDSQWVERAVRRPISRHDSMRRGHGLARLKRFLDGLDVEGSLRVIANRGDVEFLTSGRSVSLNLINDGLDGTLIMWKINGVNKEDRVIRQDKDGKDG